MITTNIFSKNLQAVVDGKRTIVNSGGTSSSKTFSILQLLIVIAQKAKEPILTSVVSESKPHLKRGCIRDFITILGEQFIDEWFNRTDCVYTFPNKSQIEFFSADIPSKLRGGRRDILFVNEANNVEEESCQQLDVRTRKLTIYDFNPVAEFWVHEKLLRSSGKSWEPINNSIEYIHSTYLDAREVLPIEVVANIEARRETDINWWNVYGLGLLGNIEGLVHPHFTTIDEMPESDKYFYGLDFGYSNDPTALVKCLIQGNVLYCDQLIYEKRLDNAQLAHRFEDCGIRKNYDEIYADSADPKSIAELVSARYNVKPCPKGKDSIIAGIQKVNQYKQAWTKRSLECIKEQRNYRYQTDSTGRYTNKPIDNYNHGIDARRYSCMGKTMVHVGEAAKVRLY